LPIAFEGMAGLELNRAVAFEVPAALQNDLDGLQVN
jgi:hypothetical protein